MAYADTANSGNSSTLTSLIHEAGPRVLAAIKHASAATGVDFSYMMEKASAESGLNAKAKSASSSATGLYQFIDSTWMDMMKKYGAKCGLGHLASCIDSNGQVANKATRQEILNLRKDPETAAMMAAEYTSENKATMQAQLGPTAQIGPTELYLAHFMGAGGATNFMKAYQNNPLQAASTVCGKAAGANHSVFYDHSGKARSLAAVYDMFAKKFGTDSTPCPTGDAKEGGSESAGAITENTMATMLLAQGGIDSAVGGTTAGSSIDDTVVAAADKADSGAPGAASPALTVVNDGAADAAASTGGTTGVRWFSPRLSIARIETAAQLNALQSSVSHLQSSLASDPAHVMLVNQHHHTASHLTGRARAHDAYSGMLS